MQIGQKINFFIFFWIGFCYFSYSQSRADSLQSTKPKTIAPSIIANVKTDTLTYKDNTTKSDNVALLPPNEVATYSSGYEFLNIHSLLSNETCINKITPTKPIVANNDGLFYVLSFIVLLLAIVKLAFPKHLVNVFSIFFQTIYRQKQTKDQLLQDKLAHLGLMLVFFGSTSVFVATLLFKYQIFALGFWQLLAICFVTLAMVYGLKYIFINLLGLLFKEQEASTTYIFLVFLINKLIGVLLIPAVILISFSTTAIAQTTLTISYAVVAVLLLYRVFLTYKSVSNRLNINIFQFFLYFCGVEILPLLLIYKTSVLYWQ